jgi:hypothetical protein
MPEWVIFAICRRVATLLLYLELSKVRRPLVSSEVPEPVLLDQGRSTDRLPLVVIATGFCSPQK